MTPSVFLFNPLTEGYIARGRAFAPVKHQALLAEDLANIPQFLCRAGDIVLLRKRPSRQFLNSLSKAGFPVPRFVELDDNRIDLQSLPRSKLRSLRPWAWGPDSIKLLQPLFPRISAESGNANRYFNAQIAQLYSKAWSADFLRKVLSRPREQSSAVSNALGAATARWLCTEQEAGVSVSTIEQALDAIAAIRARGHHRVVVKEAHGLAGHNAIRLWEPDILESQGQWLVRALTVGPIVVEPWLERELDFSVQLEMEPGRLKLCGYTGLLNDTKGQFLANWAEPGHTNYLPALATQLFQGSDISEQILRLYDEIFSMLEPELKGVGFVGPISIDALVYRSSDGACRLKPIVEMNPRCTMGRVTLEVMKHACHETCGLFRLVSLAQVRAAGCAGFADYARLLNQRLPLRMEGKGFRKIRQGAICLNDPSRAQVCLATFEVSPTLNLPNSPGASLKKQSS